MAVLPIRKTLRMGTITYPRVVAQGQRAGGANRRTDREENEGNGSALLPPSL